MSKIARKTPPKRLENIDNNMSKLVPLANMGILCAKASSGFIRFEVECKAIHTVSESSGLRTIVEHMADVTLTPVASHFLAGHKRDRFIQHFVH